MGDVVIDYKSPLHAMTQTTATRLWNDSAALDELTYAIEHGAVGATCNPVIVIDVIKKDLPFWKARIAALVRALPTAAEETIAWTLIEEMSVRAAALLEPAFERHRGVNGRLSVQTDPRLYRDTAAIAGQARRFAALAPNIIVKIPATAAGIPAMEQATYEGVSVNATVSFSVAQALAVAEAIERGLRRREHEGKDVRTMGPVCTLMVGRLDDWLKLAAESRGLAIDPGVFEWAGIAAFKKAYELYQSRRYRVRLLAAAFRNHMHWSELVGGDIVISPPHKWQVRLNASGMDPVARIDQPVPASTMGALLRLDDFRRAYAEDGMTVAEFDEFAPTRRTLRQFIAACHELDAIVRDVMLPDPDKASSH